MMRYRATRKNFTNVIEEAGFMVEDGVVVGAAPLLRKHIIGKPLSSAIYICKEQGWTVEVVKDA